MKKTIAIFMSIVVILSLMSLSVLAESDVEQQAKDLKSLGLFQGVSDTEFDLDRKPTRTEALVMLTRVLGKEDEATNGEYKHPFTDVAQWADGYVGYGYNNGLTNGVSDNLFGARSIASSQMYLTFMLRALGYSDAEGLDFTWSDPYVLAEQVGIIDENVDLINFTRADVVKVSYLSLSAKLKDSDLTLAEKLIMEGVFTLESYISIGGTVSESVVSALGADTELLTYGG